jgi:hypothetical protein
MTDRRSHLRLVHGGRRDEVPLDDPDVDLPHGQPPTVPWLALIELDGENVIDANHPFGPFDQGGPFDQMG